MLVKRIGLVALLPLLMVLGVAYYIALAMHHLIEKERV